MKVATTYWPCGKSSTGPRSTALRRWLRMVGSTAAPTAGRTAPRATRPPIPSVARSSIRLRGKRSAPVASALAEGRGVVGRRLLPEPKAQARPATKAIAAPSGAMTCRLTTRPTSSTTTPIAKLTGRKVAPVFSVSDIRRPLARSCESEDRPRGTPALRPERDVGRFVVASPSESREPVPLGGERGDRGLGRRRHERRTTKLAGAIDLARRD